jgi:hypothetical protein
MLKKLFSVAFAFIAVAAFGIGASQEWVKDYVKKSTVSTNLVDALSQILASKNDDEIKVDAEGRLYYTVLEKINGSYTNTVHYLTPSNVEEIRGTFYGAIVTESVNGFFKAGDTLAFAAGPGGKIYLVNGLKQMEYYEYQSKFERPTNPRRYIFGDANEVVTNSLTITCRTWNEDSSKVTGQFTIEPCHLLEETWENCVKSFPIYTYGAVTNTANANYVTWAEKAPNVQKSLRMVCNAPRIRMMRSGGASAEQPTVVTILFTPYPNGAMVDTMDYAIANNYKVDYYGEMMTPSHEICWAEPAAIYPANVWNSLEAWTVLPQTVTVYYKSEEDGLWYPTEKKIRTVAALQNLLAAYPGVKFPPRDWPGFKLVAKEDCRRSGNHIYGDRCECIICGVQREHKWAFLHDNECARCINEKDAWHVDIRGQKVKTYPNGGGGYYCEVTPKSSGGDYADMDLHGGWHHEAVEGDESHNCSCECGFYAKNNHLLPHVFNFVEGDTIQESDWSKFDKNGNMDGIHHFAVFTCERCQDAKREIKEKHKIINLENDSMPAEWVDREHHHAHGFCEICEFGKVEGENAYLLEEHSLDENCYCEKCDTVNHNWHDRICGNNINRVCLHCAHVDGTDGNPAEHDYGEPLEEHHEKYRSHHRCFCGLGELEEHTFENGVCSGCGMRQKTGVKCASKKRGSKAPDSGSANSDDVHTSDRSGTGGFFCTDLNVTDKSDHACPDCGGGFFIDYPEAKAFASEPGAWEYTMSGAMGIETYRWRGEDATLTNTLRTVNSLIGIIERAEKNVGSRVEIKVKWNPLTTIELTFENFAFLPGAKAIYGESWGSEAIYSGSILNDPEFGVIIDWK